MKIRKEGLPFIFISGLISLLLFLTRLRIFALAPVMFVVWFFRDPERVVPAGGDTVLSPADGKIIDIAETEDEFVGKCTKVAIFMSVFNVHVNRFPVSGVVVEKRYRPGKFHMAHLGKKTEANERMMLYIKNEDGTYRVDQVAGLIARRISCFPEVGDTVTAGERMGLIRFGSLLECFMPPSMKVVVNKGDTAVAGETVLGRKEI